MEIAGMTSCFSWPIFLLTIQLSFPFSLPSGGTETDRLSLLAFKDQIKNDPLNKVVSSWNESLHFCEWSGVTCGRRHQRVVKLDLHSYQLVGSLSPHIGNLSFLRILNLENNSFSHDIPQELGRLFRLQTLVLRNNSFSGEIPANISHCSNLSRLHLGVNNLTGKLPEELGSLSKLQVFIFHVNNLFGEIPRSFGNLSFIEEISGERNNLQGGIPNDLGQLKRLSYFSVNINNLSGTIPPSIYNLSSLTTFSLMFNQLHGSLPLDLGQTLPHLEIFRIYSNLFSGLIPVTLSNSSTLSIIDLGNNSFHGEVPTFTGLPNLQVLGIDSNDLGGEDDDLSFLYPLANSTLLELLAINNNNFRGELPEIVSNFSTKLRKIVFGRNQIRGSIPVGIGNLISLDTLGLETNQLTGSIPSSVGKLKNLNFLSLMENQISGNIPSSLGNITSLVELYLDVNNLQGSIPSSLGNFRNLYSLDISQNNFSGPIPKEVIGMSSISIKLDLSQNQLTGTLPSEVAKLVNLGFLDVSHNSLSGEIPRSLGSCIVLETLNLEGNFFQGPVPESLSSLKALQVLNLSYNNLTGQIPKFFADLKLLQSLDLSFNDLGGKVPTDGVFGNASEVSVSGNKKLCGGIPQLNLSSCTSSESTKLKSSTKLVLEIAVPCGLVGVILMVSSLVFYIRRKTKIDTLASEASQQLTFRRVAYEELFEATGGFSSSNLIGSGSFGSVYRGILSSDGAVVAVKVFNLLRKGASKSFIAECAALINIRHRNLLKVITACSSINVQGNDFKALVYEFMANGSLEEWLHPVQTSDEEHKARNLNLIQRLNIAIDVACALDYLHHQCQMAVIHCDLKPCNVLLDADMTAHVGDFGLARFRPEASGQSSSGQTSSIGLKGTVGYAAPEYGFGNDVSTYGDVYSYGILLLEMFTGRRPTDGMFKEGLNLHNYVKMAFPDHVTEVADPILLREAEETSAADASHRMKRIGNDKILECLIAIMEVGVACSVDFPRERADIRNVVAELHRIRGILLGTGSHGQLA